MGRTGTVTVLFTDIVGSTDLLRQLGERAWNDARRDHFAVLRTAITEHDGTEVKNTGDGLMAVFGSAVDAVNCAVVMQQRAPGVVVGGKPVGLRIGMSMGEASNEQGDWFGTPVVEAARLCALAENHQSWASGLVAMLAGSQSAARFVSLGHQVLKGFDTPVEVFNVEGRDGVLRSMFVEVEQHAQLGEGLVAQLDYWEQLTEVMRMRADMLAELAPLPGDVVCDIGCGAGSEVIQIARRVGPDGVAIGVDPSPTMLDVTRARAEQQDVRVELHTRDGRDTGLDDARCDAVRMERVIQHVGDLPGFLAEAKRITRPGGRIVIADTDWGSFMMHPGDPDVIRRIKAAFEAVPLAEPWAGRILHDGMLDCGLTDVTSRMYPINAGPGILTALAPMFERFAEARIATRTEIDDLFAALDSALERGAAVIAFTMFVASGRVPTDGSG